MRASLRLLFFLVLLSSALCQTPWFLDANNEDVCLWKEGLGCGECTADSYPDDSNTCETVCNMTTTCSGHGRCVFSVAAFPCHCFPGWTGESCSICSSCKNATVVTLAFSQGSVETFNSSRQIVLLQAISKFVNIAQSNIQITAVADSADGGYPLIVQLVLYSAGKQKGDDALSKRFLRANAIEDLATTLANEGDPVEVRLQKEPTEVTDALPKPRDRLPDNVPNVEVSILILNQTVETFGKSNQDVLKEAVGDLLGLDPADLTVVLVAEPTINGDKVRVEVRGFPTVSNVSLPEVAKKIEDLGDKPLDEYPDLPFDAELDGPPTVVWGLVTTIGLSAGDVEGLNVTNQAKLLAALAEVLDLEVSELEVTGAENSGDADMPLVVQVIIVPADKAENLTALAALVESKVGSGELRSKLADRGMTVDTTLESLGVGTSATLPEPIVDGGLPDDVPHFVGRFVIQQETVESFDAAKQDQLKRSLASLLHLLAEDLEVVLLHEPVIGGASSVLEIRGSNTSNATMDAIALAICLSADDIASGTFPPDAQLGFEASLLWPLTVVGNTPGDLAACPAGSSGENCISCQPCAAGTYKAANGSDACTLCPAGTFSTVVGAVSPALCSACPPNSSSLEGSGSAADCACSAGFTGGASGTDCRPCAGGTYKPALGSEACTLCRNGTFSSALGASTADACRECPASSVSAAGSRALADCRCKPGSFLELRVGGSASCEPCAAGTYNGADGATVCEQCSAATPRSPVASLSASQCFPAVDEGRACGHEARPADSSQLGAMAWCMHAPTNAMCRSAAGPAPTDARSGHTAVAVGESFVVLFGGSEDAAVHVLAVQFPGLVWRDPPLVEGERPAARRLHSSVVRGDTMVVFGGVSAHTGAVLSDVWALDLGLWTWARLDDAAAGVPVRRHSHAAVVVGDELIVVGGKATAAGDCSAEVWAFSFLQGAWAQKPATATPASLCSCQAALTAAGHVAVLLQDAGDVYKLDTATWAWTAAPVARADEGGASAASAALVGRALVAFGADCSATSACSFKSMDLDSLAWTSVAVRDLDRNQSDGTALPVGGVFSSVGGDVVITGSENNGQDAAVLLSVQGAVLLKQTVTRDVGAVVLYDAVPPPRSRAAVAVADGRALLFGGLVACGEGAACAVQCSDETWAYDLKHMRWFVQPLAARPAARQGHSMVAWNAAAFLFGGSTSYLPLPPSSALPAAGASGAPTAFNDVWKFAASQWVEVSMAGVAPSGREAHTAVPTASGFIVFGGIDSTAYDGTRASIVGAGKDVWIADLTSNTWSSVAPGSDAPSATCFHAAAVVGEAMLVYGGLVVSDMSTSGEMWALQLAGADAWTWAKVEAASSFPVLGHSLLLVGSSAYLFGGLLGAPVRGASNAVPSNAVFKLDTEALTWATVEPKNAPAPRSLHCATSVGGKMIVFGGAGLANANGTVATVLFDDVQILEIGSVVPLAASSAATHLSLACDLCTVLLPARVRLGVSRIFSSAVFVEPFNRTAVATLADAPAGASHVECSSVFGCDSLLVRHVDFEAGALSPGRAFAALGEGTAVTLAGCSFTDIRCAASGCVGLSAAGASLTLHGVRILRVQSDADGGALWVRGAAATLQSCSVEGTAAAGSGGVVFVEGLEQSRFAPSFVSQQTLYTRNAAGDGGGCVYCGRGASCRVAASAFVGNTARAFHGGAILADRAALSVLASNFSDNRAANGGGGAVFWAVVVPSEQDVRCSNNSALHGACFASNPFSFRFEYAQAYYVARLQPRPSMEASHAYVLDYYGQPVWSRASASTSTSGAAATDAFIATVPVLQGTTVSRVTVPYAGFAMPGLAEAPVYWLAGLAPPTRNATDRQRLAVTDGDGDGERTALEAAVADAVCANGSVLAANPNWPPTSTSTSTSASSGSVSATVGECRFCEAGSYSFGTGETRGRCLPCPAGATCRGGFNVETGVGAWAVRNGSLVLVSCPEGHSLVNSTDGTSAGAFSHDAQACKACPASSFVLDPARDACEPCPPSQHCFGNSTVVPRAGARETWEVVDGALRLRGCPTGFFISNTSTSTSTGTGAAREECRACGVGEECTLPASCTACSPCAAGAVKSAAGAHACVACPLNTYEEGGACVACPDYAYTAAGGMSAKTSCVCGDLFYLTAWDAAAPCRVCPLGAVSDSGVCALNKNATCSDCDAVVGVWEPGEDGAYRLVSCPDGYALTDAAVHDSQRCAKCLPNQYIADPNTDACEWCPPGLRCFGNSTVLPVLAGSEWELEAGTGTWELVRCPTGYRVFNATREQECVACGLGEACTRGVCEQCEPCAPGTYKSVVGTAPCAACPEGTFSAAHGARSVAACTSCPPGALTRGNGSTGAEDCICDARSYIRQLGDGSVECEPCPIGGKCADGTCALATDPPACRVGDDGVIGNWSRDASGLFRLVGCPAGYRLLNSTSLSATGTFSAYQQQCQACPVGQYILDPLHARCKPCPAGLLCSGAGYEAVTAGALWEQRGEELVLARCPLGFLKHNASLAEQECKVCGAGHHCFVADCSACQPCAPGTYKESEGAQACSKCPSDTYSAALGARTLALCQACPVGSVTLDAGSTSLDDCTCDGNKYQSSAAGEPFVCTTCPVGAVCDDTSCAFARGAPCEPVGTWAADGATGKRVLVACPEGSSLLNETDDTQQCLECAAETQYVINPNTDACERCPPGLQCFGNSTVVPTLPGSTWVAERGVYTLTGCPAGYAVFNETLSTQECRACGLGEQCVLAPCRTCSPCPAGSFKSTAGTAECAPCPASTYNAAPGKTRIADCTACPDFAYTAAPGQTDRDSCQCGARYYFTAWDAPEVCKACPAAAVCADGSCAFSGAGCAGDVVGNWSVGVGSDRLYYLRNCPPGYSLVNSLDGTSAGAFSHDSQACRACDADTQYILNPDTDACQRCPPGLRCFGNSTVVPTLAGSEWEARDGRYVLTQCPQGYGIYNASFSTQECRLCGVGEECPRASCTACAPCAAGTYKDAATTAACLSCPAGTFGPAVGATTLQQCTLCPAGATTASIAHTRAEACSCLPALYPLPSLASAVVAACAVCPLGALCADGSCRFARADKSCPAEPADAGLVGAWEQQQSAQGSERENQTVRAVGSWVLVGCPAGFQLVNSSSGSSSGDFSAQAQHCRACARSSQYILNPDTDACQRCPPGLRCFGNSTVVPTLAGSEWVVEERAAAGEGGDGAVFRLTSCPTGYFIFPPVVDVGDASAAAYVFALQECRACGKGAACESAQCTACTECIPGFYKASPGPEPCLPCPAGTYGESVGAASLEQCTACPFGSESERAGSARYEDCRCPPSKYLALTNTTQDPRMCVTCPVGARLNGTEKCAFGVAADAVNLQAQDVLGEWAVGADGRVRLLSCPDGTSLVNSVDGTSTGVFSHDSQQCRVCLAGKEYVVTPNTDACQLCPPGLQCFGGADVEPVVPGSVWDAVHGVWILQSCPSGYAVHNASVQAQECRACGVGEECTRASCHQCTPCGPGTYKDVAAPTPCTWCPPNTFAAEPGATALASCQACPRNSFSTSESATSGATSVDACVCDPHTYRVEADAGRDVECIACPVGATCGDGFCALAMPNLTCWDGVGVVGSWERDPADGKFRVEACPAGHQRINSVLGTAVGAFSHGVQQCYKCVPELEYIVDTIDGACQPCPVGLVCEKGDDDVRPWLEGAEWELDLGAGVFRLQSCPQGYRVYDFTPELQDCQACEKGSQCAEEDCKVCTPCPAGTYKTAASSALCEPCPPGTYSDVEGAIALQTCKRCPRGATTGNGSLATSVFSCLCDDEHYPIAGTGGSGLRCEVCPVGGLCPDGRCALNLEGFLCNRQSLTSGPVGRWAEGGDGRYQLESCPDGYALINSTEGTAVGEFNHFGQQCKACLPKYQFYIIDAGDGCQTCPEGLICDGDWFVEPKTNGSLWARENALYKLRSCPRGYRMYDFKQELQECQACGYGEHCPAPDCRVCEPCPPGTYKDAISPQLCLPCPANTFGPDAMASTLAQCRACPDHAATPSSGSVTAAACACQDAYYPAVSAAGVLRECLACPLGARCSDGSCALTAAALSCPDGTAVVGDWERSADGTGAYRLVSCHEGHSLVNSSDGTAEGDFFQELQQCRACDADTQYILHPDTDTCQGCPPGLVCDGTAAVEAVTDGAVWVAVGDKYVLERCPPGFRTYTLAPELQECQPCGFGEQCVEELCHVCTPCAPGTYKDSVSAQACAACPRNSFRAAAGATALVDCTACPAFSATAREASTNASDCECSPAYYFAEARGSDGNRSGAAFSCERCPIGAVCDDGSCALAAHPIGCAAAGGRPPGEWVRGDDGVFRLEQCPAGHALVNASDGTSHGEFLQEVQQCKACHATDEFILDPNADECQRCPPGLVCNGTASVLPAVAGSVWAPVGDVYVLQSCPTGYRLYNFTVPLQECQPCGAGEHCAAETCHVCAACEPGSFKEVVAPTLCRACPLHTFAEQRGAVSRADCAACPEHAVTASPGASSLEQCECDARHYAVVADGVDGGAGFKCLSCPAGAVCGDGTCAFARADGTCAPANANANASNGDGDGGNASGTPPVGEWVARGDGLQLLVSCPAGHMLVNSSSGTSAGTFNNEAQQCRACARGEQYVIDDLDECQPCPTGLICGAVGVTPVVAGSVWELVGDAYVLKSCPPGYRFYNLSAAFQECQACAKGASCEGAGGEPCMRCESCAAGTFKDSSSNATCSECPLNTYNTEAGATSLSDCTPCHAAAFTAGPRSTEPEACVCASRFYYGRDERGDATCYACPEGALCTDGKCFGESALNASECRAEADSARVGAWTRAGEGPWMLESCPDGYQLINSTARSARGVFSNVAQQCRACLADVQYIVADTAQCETCPPGLLCDGTSNVKALVEGSVWRAEHGVLRLQSCPTGYRLYNFTSWLQECQPCGLGEECNSAVCHVCTLCSAGTYKDIRGPHLCRRCPLDTYGPERGATEQDQCRQCPSFAQTLSDGQVRVEDCECDGLFYLAFPRGRDQPTCMNCPVGGLCPTRTCAFRLDPAGRASQELPSCEGNGTVVGAWALANDTTWRLLSCPPGHELVNSLGGTAGGEFEFSHDAQHCAPCLLSEYIVDPDTHTCQKCPPGLVCRDGVVVRERVAGSMWDIVDGVYLLRSCPVGYRTALAAPELHECRECLKGSECAVGNCSECSDCAPGYYKLTDGPQLCQACPRNTFNPESGAAAIENCIACSAGAVTDGEAKSDPLDCVCAESLYTIFDEAEYMVMCMVCPAGAVCPDGTCALRTNNHTCPPPEDAREGAVASASSTWARIPGEWRRDNASLYRVRSCPLGYKLINSSDATAFGVFSHDVQQCFKCRHCIDGAEWCRGSDYIGLGRVDDAILYECQPCPLGAECNGHQLRTAHGLDFYDPPALWELDNASGILHLVQCPTGFKMETLIGIENQECAKCPAGWFIAKSNDPTIICYVCPESASCPNGGPPLFAHSSVASSLLVAGITELDTDTQNAITSSIAEAIGVNPDQIEIIETCVLDASGTSTCTPLRRGIGRRRLRSDSSAAAIMMAVAEAPGSRGLLQASGIEIGFRVPARIGSEKAVAANLTTSSFAGSVASNLQSRGVPVSVAPSGKATEELSAFVGERFELTSNGAPKLLDCEQGYLLVNNTINTQECSFCLPQTYSVNPFDKCSVDKAYCEKRDCSLCSAGATCRGGNSFEPKVKASLWKTEYVPFANSWLFRITYAPPGYIMIRGVSPEDDQAIACNEGEYALEPGVPGGNVMFKPTLASFVPDARLCLPCPKGAFCSGPLGVLANPRFWRGTSMRCPESACTARGCTPSKCSDLYDTGLNTEDGDQVRARAMVYRCIFPGVCEGNVAPVNALDPRQRREGEEEEAAMMIDSNGCVLGHAGPLCGVCLYGYAQAVGRCIKCESTGLTAVPALIIAGLVLVVGFGYYMVSWEPVLNDPDKRPNVIVAKLKQYPWERVRDAMKVMIGFFQVGGSFITTFAVDWPPNLVGMLAVASSLVQFDVLSIPGLTCLTSNISFTYRMMISTLVPVVGVFFLLLPLVYAGLFRRTRRPPDDMTREIEEQWKKLEERRGKLDIERKELHALLKRLPAGSAMLDGEARTRVEAQRARLVARHQKLWGNANAYDAARLELEAQARRAVEQLALHERHQTSKKKTFQAFWHALFFLLFATYPAASRISIKAFACKYLGSDGTWVRDDMSYPCPSLAKDPLTFLWALGSTVLIPFGVPAYCIYKFNEHGVPRLAEEKAEAEIISGFLSKMARMNVKLDNFTASFGKAPDAAGINRKIKFAMRKVLVCVCFKCEQCGTVRCPACQRCKHNRAKPPFRQSIFDRTNPKECAECADYAHIASESVCRRCECPKNAADFDEKKWFGAKGEEPAGFGVEKLGQLMHQMGLTALDDADLIRLINLHGCDGKINRRQVRTALRELCMRLKYRQQIVHGSEGPTTLSNAQLKVLCEEPWERQVGYNHKTYSSGVAGVLDGTSFVCAQAGLTDAHGRLLARNNLTEEEQIEFAMLGDKYEFASRRTLIKILERKGLNFKAYGDVTVQSVKWDGTTPEERKAIEDLGFLFLTYKPRCWWFELFELGRKLIIVGTLAFVWDGTPSQVAVGFFISIFCLVFALNVQPFSNPVLQRLYYYALVVQAGTLLYGLYLITEQFDEITGEEDEGWVGGFNVRDFVLVCNCTIFSLPFIMVLSGFRQEVMKHVIHWKNRFFPCCMRSTTTRRQHEPDTLGNAPQEDASNVDVTKLHISPVSRDAELMPVGHGDDSDDNSDGGGGEERAAWDAFAEVPTAAEYGGIVRMEQHCALLEAGVLALLRHEEEGDYGKDFERRLDDVKILLDQAKVDAAVLQEEMPTGEAQDQLEHIAFGTLDYIQALVNNLADETHSLPRRSVAEHADWDTTLFAPGGDVSPFSPARAARSLDIDINGNGGPLPVPPLGHDSNGNGNGSGGHAAQLRNALQLPRSLDINGNGNGSGDSNSNGNGSGGHAVQLRNALQLPEWRPVPEVEATANLSSTMIYDDDVQVEEARLRSQIADDRDEDDCQLSAALVYDDDESVHSVDYDALGIGFS